jgi:hypothetical protein
MTAFRNDTYVSKSFAQAVALMLLGYEPVAISGDPQNPIFFFKPEARAAGAEFVMAKSRLTAHVYEELAPQPVRARLRPANDDERGNR